MPEWATIHRLFEEQAARTPNVTAVIHRGARLAYGELNERANRLAHHLRGLGVGPEVRVGVAMERAPELIVALYAVLKAGGAYVPVDPAYPAERIAWMLDDARAPVVLTNARLIDRLGLGGAADADRSPSPTPGLSLPRNGGGRRGDEQGGGPPRPRIVLVDTQWPDIAEHCAENPAPLARPENLAYAIYTPPDRPDELQPLPEQARLERMLAWINQDGPVLPEGDTDLLRRYLRVVLAGIRAAEAYQPRLYRGRVLVLQAADRVRQEDEFARAYGVYSQSDYSRGWTDLCVNPVESVLVPGDHYSLLGDAHVGGLAAHLREAMDKSTAGARA